MRPVHILHRIPLQPASLQRAVVPCAVVLELLVGDGRRVRFREGFEHVQPSAGEVEGVAEGRGEAFGDRPAAVLDRVEEARVGEVGVAVHVEVGRGIGRGRAGGAEAHGGGERGLVGRVHVAVAVEVARRVIPEAHLPIAVVDSGLGERPVLFHQARHREQLLQQIVERLRLIGLALDQRHALVHVLRPVDEPACQRPVTMVIRDLGLPVMVEPQVRRLRVARAVKPRPGRDLPAQSVIGEGRQGRRAHAGLLERDAQQPVVAVIRVLVRIPIAIDDLLRQVPRHAPRSHIETTVQYYGKVAKQSRNPP
ncbi:MAG: hypothetical protein FLDDKLPJ_03303 [Phycisphaerae bacterium]|nr:hypothetical protein [Phycisphaerae bacterium]